MQEVIFWLVLLIICIGIEVATMGLTTIWFAGGALIAIFAAVIGCRPQSSSLYPWCCFSLPGPSP